MTILFDDNPYGLFTRIGAMGGTMSALRAFQKGDFETTVEAILAQFDETHQPEVAAPLATGMDGGKKSIAAFQSTIKQVALSCLSKTILDDSSQPDSSTKTLIIELIRQMVGATETVKACTIAATVASIGSPTGTGNIVVSTKRGDGLVQENTFAEVGVVTCIADAQSGGQTAGYEQLQYKGDLAISDPLLYTWPGGSGANLSFFSVNAQEDNSQGNLLTNSGFETEVATNGLPDNWATETGTPVTHFDLDAVTFYTGSKSFKFIGNGATLAGIQQTFDLAAGTLGKLKPATQYALNFWAKCDVVPAAGVLQVALVDGSGTIVADVQAVNNATTFSVPGFSTSWVAKSATFRTPNLMPSTIKLRIKQTTAISMGSILFLDQMALTEMSKLYLGGPYIAAFSGATNWLLNDKKSVTITNDRGGAADLDTFQTLMDRLFNLRTMEQLLPSSGSPSISDTLIS